MTNEEIDNLKLVPETHPLLHKEAMEKHNNGVASYRTSEGRCVTVPYKGLASDVVKDAGGIRSANADMSSDNAGVIS